MNVSSLEESCSISRRSGSRRRLRMPPWGRALRIIAIALAAPFLIQAQLAGTGAISGTIQDPSGAVIANAIVTATNLSTNEKTVRTSTSAGDYTITPLTPGSYTVTVTAPGFQRFNQQNITVDATSTVSLNVKLSIGQADQTVTVSTAPPLLSTADATLGGVMDNEMYSNLPIQMGQGGNNDQRRATDFEYLMPGVQSNYTSNNSTDNSGIVNGSGPAGGVSEIYIEGVNLPEADQVGDPRFTWTSIGVDAVNQFQVLTAGYSAQYAGQGVENYSIKQGGNTIHGSIYEYLRNTALDAWKFTSKVPTYNSQGVLVPGGIKPKEIQNEFGIVLSGPIIKDKLFLFYNYGQYRNQNGPTYSAQTIPTAAMLGYTQSGTALGYADFRGYAAANNNFNIYDPATQTPGCAGTNASPCTRTQFRGAINNVPTANVIPGNRISTASAYIDQFLLPYEKLANQNLYSGNIYYGTPTGLANWYQTGRLDYNENAKNQISIIVAFGRQASTGPNSVGSGQLGPPFNTSQSYTPKTTVDMFKDTFIFTPHVVNQFAVAYGRYKSLSVSPDDTTQYSAATIGLTNTPAGQATNGFPEIQYSGGDDDPATQAGYGWNLKVNNTYNISDNLQWVFGKHDFTFGGQVVEQQFNYNKEITASGPMDYTFAASQTAAFTTGNSLNSQTGSAVASYLLGAANAGTVTYGVPGLGSRWLDPSFWAQDDYKATSKLTFNLGVRWDIYPSIHVAHNLFTFLNPNQTNSITGNRGTLEFAGSGAAGTYCNCQTPSPVWYKNIAPRLGAAYSIDPKTVVRASYDLAFARGNWTSGSQSGSPSTLGLTPSATAPAGISSAPAFYWDESPCAAGNNDGVNCGWTGSITQPTPPAGGTSLAEYATTETAALGNSGSGTVTYFDPYRGSRTPEFIDWTVGIQRQITKDMSLTVSYVGSEGHFISISKAVGSRNNELPESMAALAGYNVSGGTATPCSAAGCTAPLLTQTATASNLALASGLGFTPPNGYNSSLATYYAKNDVYQYYYPFPQYSGVSDSTSFVGNSAFSALEITVRQRSSHGLDFMFNYTYSKAIDDLGTFRVGDNDRLDRSLSTTDQPQNLTATAVYASPFGRGKIGNTNFLVRALASDWKISGIFVYHSGLPIVVTGTGCGGNGILNQCMPNIVPGKPGRINGKYGAASGHNTATTYNTVQYLNPAAFTVDVPGTVAQYGTSVSTNSTQATYVGNGPALYVPGNAPRVAALNLWAMATYDLDLAVKRVFPIHHNWNLLLEADILNATNHVVWSAPNANVNSGSGFGEITSLANTPRDVQLSARLSW